MKKYYGAVISEIDNTISKTNGYYNLKLCMERIGPHFFRWFLIKEYRDDFIIKFLKENPNYEEVIE